MSCARRQGATRAGKARVRDHGWGCRAQRCVEGELSERQMLHNLLKHLDLLIGRVQILSKLVILLRAIGSSARL